MDNQIVKTSPFSYRSNQVLKQRDHGAGASLKRITILWQKNLINEKHIPVITILHELIYATGHMVEECYALSKSTKVSFSAGNAPVKKLLQDLSNFGVVDVYSTHDGNFYTGAKIYTLSKGAKDWIEQILHDHIYFKGLTMTGIKQVWSYTDILSILAANQFLIRMKANGLNKGQRYLANEILDAYEESKCIVYIPVRRNTSIPEVKKLEECLKCAFKGIPYTYILGCEDSEHTIYLHHKIKQDQNLFYITDQMVFYSRNPLENLTSYRNPESNETILASIDL